MGRAPESASSRRRAIFASYASVVIHGKAREMQGEAVALTTVSLGGLSKFISKEINPLINKTIPLDSLLACLASPLLRYSSRIRHAASTRATLIAIYGSLERLTGYDRSKYRRWRGKFGVRSEVAWTTRPSYNGCLARKKKLQ